MKPHLPLAPGLMAAFTALIFLFLATDLALAEKRSVKPGEEARQWSAVGILTVRGGSWCSAALIDTDTVLTAAHCVYPDGNRTLYPPEAMTFHAGWRDGISAATRGVTRVTAHRDYDPKRPYDARNIAADLAIVELDEPIPHDVAAAYPQLDRIRIGLDVTSISFSGRRADVATLNDGCRVVARKGDRLSISCATSPGMSGSPLFGFVNGKPHIVALISGARQDESGKITGIALAIDDPLTRVRHDAAATRSQSRAALPHWTRRVAASGTRIPTATRKSVRAGTGAGLSALTGSGQARQRIRPPSGD